MFSIWKHARFFTICPGSDGGLSLNFNRFSFLCINYSHKENCTVSFTIAIFYLKKGDRALLRTTQFQNILEMVPFLICIKKGKINLMWSLALYTQFSCIQQTGTLCLCSNTATKINHLIDALYFQQAGGKYLSEGFGVCQSGSWWFRFGVSSVPSLLKRTPACVFACRVPPFWDWLLRSVTIIWKQPFGFVTSGLKGVFNLMKNSSRFLVV